ncbi:MAG: hypothetical protein M0Z89_00445 [Nitrospiraceae bacterium]|nr:hypothetical protein [Nitrospiraceae bacterium]
MGKLQDMTPVMVETQVKMNCWEFKKCGRQPGGHKAEELGICPATTHKALDNAHAGKNAGRACWVVAGSLCGGKIQGTYAQKLNNCWRCEFMNMVKKEEEPTEIGFSHTRLGMEKTLEKQKHKQSGSPQRVVHKKQL